LVNVFRSDGTAVTQDGVYGYGASYFGCCRRSYNVTYTTKAPYASANLKLGAASLGASLRYDTVRARVDRRSGPGRRARGHDQL
jgi:hypothetical protein